MLPAGVGLCRSGRREVLCAVACGSARWGGMRPASPANRCDLPPLNRFSFAQRPELKASRPVGA